MLRIDIQCDPKYQRRFQGIIEVANLLRDLGVEITQGLSDADIVFTQLSVARERGLFHKSSNGPPIIVFERADSASISLQRDRVYAGDPRVVGWAKEMTFRDTAYHNKSVVMGKYFHKLISDLEPTLPDPQLSEVTLEKIEPIFPIYAQERYNSIRFCDAGQFKDRSCDVFYSGTVSYDVPFITKHREDCCNILSGLKGLNVLVGVGRTMPVSAFHSCLLNSKIFVSPYGYGEYSWKDYEALYAGCILVKPFSDFVVAYGLDIYSNGVNYVACKPNLTDLAEVVETLLASPNSMSSFALGARQRLEAVARSLEQRAQDFAAFFNRCAARIA